MIKKLLLSLALVAGLASNAAAQGVARSFYIDLTGNAKGPIGLVANGCAAPGLYFQSNLTTGIGQVSNTVVSFCVAAAEIARVTNTGLMFQTDNSFDIGANGATRPRNYYAGTAFIGPMHSIAGAGTTSGNGGQSDSIAKTTSSIANATATNEFTVTVPNAAHTATIELINSCFLGAGGAIGTNEAAIAAGGLFVVTRTPGVATVVANSVFANPSVSVAGGATITYAQGNDAMSGAVGATQTFHIQVTVTHGTGSSTNHVCNATARILNANSSGITLQ